MNILRSLTAALALVALTACPADDAGDDGGTSRDARASADAGHLDSTGSPDLLGADAAGTDAAGADAAAADAATCTPPSFDLCVGLVSSGSQHQLRTAEAALAGDHSYAIGATWGQVRAAMGSATWSAAPFNSFAVVYCGEGLLLYFADNLGEGSTDEGALSDDDPLYKITAFGNFGGETDTAPAIGIGASQANVATALGAADFEGTSSWIDGTAGVFWYYDDGQSALLHDQTVQALSIFGPQQPGAIDLTLDFAAGTVGGISVRHSMLTPTGSTVAEIKAALGDAPESYGDTPLSIGGFPVTVFVISYSNLGLRFSGLASQTDDVGDPILGDARKVYTAVITPPFQGADNQVALGASRAQIEAQLGAPYDQAEDDQGRVLFKYNAGSRKAGVVYVDDSECVQRAALFFLNLLD